ncbi:MAG TPA: 2-amino-4-hydroxy-6-hydroxymethyldihydropteridine diphosphokinase [Ignavibacteria bacterium]|nr:2-amino-4-hydroxy-6-hydroxymethyldihydropteridine diphosphokinase [Ignavibacteria bacterium]HMQ99217.1 2-amino-4-hydroxy-6-hydroxymethyldihydropteridine diphosphokinase [Ignavibacteria bacterium]
MPGLVVLGFGSNIGNRFRNINFALKTLALNKSLNLLKVSDIYETEPWGFKKQRSFFNCAAVFRCRLQPLELLRLAKSVEKKAGRTSSPAWQARKLDIDILFYGGCVIHNKLLKIPHQYLECRNFVLKPLVDIIPGFIHPVLKKSILDLYNSSRDICKVKRISSFDK